ncbi:penicillin acylase family protein [Corallococcus aberystwythensis]|uniref:Penicillin acylase family protein n=1 Tax=Corallococcus aberystwythensis TaxID=2316722 RepID=A0A3A8QY09_9BACT|nr:penicillin acylase family protein [Corallococcus aberystwythensis]RKH68024.1 penicillin acylase family protein [Corallococcus aberystwythensis]
MRTSRISLPLLLTLTAFGGCRNDDPPAPSPLKATLHRTAYGIPHIQADGYRSLGAGIGYAQAQDAVCILADQFLKVRGERARYLGRGPQDAYLESDFTYLGLALRTRAEAAFAEQSQELRDLVQGYAAGYNQYLKDVPADQRPAACRGAAWVKPISAYDLLAYHLDLSLNDTLVPLLGYVGNAQPPSVEAGAQGPRSGPLAIPPRKDGLGSNGWALGREKTASGRGMLVANPHFPWEGSLRFHESHQTIPGKLDVYGVSLLGVPAINIGFNRDIAWTHTVTASSHMTLYRLKLVPGDPTAYVYDGAVRRMTSRTVTAAVRGDDGGMTQETRTFWRSHYGPMLAGPGADWAGETAYTTRDATEDNPRFVEHWLRLNTAHSIDEAADVERTVRGAPWVNTLLASAAGDTRYVDASRVPYLSPATVAAYRDALESTPDAPVFASLGLVLLDGSTSRDEWVGLEGESHGLVPATVMPQLRRTDFVMNANDPATFVNPAEPLINLPFLYEIYGTRGRMSTRSHMNLTLITEEGATAAAGSDGRFTREEAEQAILSNRTWVAEQLRTAVVQRCQGAGPVLVQDVPVDITEACQLLAAWDGRLELDRTGAIVWREFLNAHNRSDLVDQGSLFAQPFDPARAAVTPAGLVPAPVTGVDPVNQKLAEAVALLGKAGIAVGTKLGDVQFAWKGDRKVPLHGGAAFEGVTNVVGYSGANATLLPQPQPQGPLLSPGTGLTPEGYPVDFGTSFLMVMEFTAEGPKANAVLSYAESANPESPHFADQTDLFSGKQFRPVRFNEAEILADPELTTTELIIDATSKLE